jgi:hypothetical protein
MPSSLPATLYEITMRVLEFTVLVYVDDIIGVWLPPRDCRVCCGDQDHL